MSDVQDNASFEEKVEPSAVQNPTNEIEGEQTGDLSDLFRFESVEETPKEEPTKYRQGIFVSQGQKIKELYEAKESGVLDDDSYEFEKEEILAKYPKMREELEKEVKKIEKFNDEFENIKKERDSLKTTLKKQQEERDEREAKKILSETLEEYGISESSFKEKYGKEFTNIILKRRKENKDSLVDATDYATAILFKKINKESRETSTVPRRGATSSSGSFKILTNAEYIEMVNSGKRAEVMAYDAESQKRYGEVKLS